MYSKNNAYYLMRIKFGCLNLFQAIISLTQYIVTPKRWSLISLKYDVFKIWKENLTAKISTSVSYVSRRVIL